MIGDESNSFEEKRDEMLVDQLCSCNYAGGRFRGHVVYLNVQATVEVDHVEVDYICSCLSRDESDHRKNGDVACGYTIKFSGGNK